MWNAVSGGCQCGRVRFELTAPPLTAYICHCKECQKQSASAFGISVMVSKSTFRVTQGSTRRWSRPAASGEEILANFCDHCGARLFHERAGGDAVNVKGGALDDTTWLKPVGHQWLSSAQPWMRALVDRLDTLKYPGQAPKSELIARYGSAHG